MAITELYTNTATISTTEYSLPNNSTTLTPKTDDGIFQVFIDVSALTVTERYRIKVLEKIVSGGTQRKVIPDIILEGAQVPPHLVIPSLVFLHGWDITMTKVAGTDRSITWSIRQVT